MFNNGKLALYAQRLTLTIQLTQNVNLIASNSVDNATAVTIYFIENLLYKNVTTKPAAVAYKP